MELRSRSRSNTPFRTSENESIQNQINHSHAAKATRITRSSKFRAISEVLDEPVIVKSTSTTHKSSKSNHQTIITSDYSSEDGDHDSTFTDNRTNHALESTQSWDNHNEDDEHIALKIYRDAKEYWNRYPKTDYTYSPHSKDRVELAPGVVNMPNMSRKSIRELHENGEFVHKQTNTEFIQTSHKTTRRNLFGNINNNEIHVLKSSSITSIHRVSIFQRIMYTVLFIFWVASRPLTMAHSLLVQGVSVLHRLASHMMMLDTWALRKSSKERHQLHHEQERSKILHLVALCLIPLLLFGGMWLLSTVGNALGILIASMPEILATTPIAGQEKSASELTIKVQLDSPFRAGLSNMQLEQIAQSLKENLPLDLEVNSIVKILMDDPNVQRLDDRSAALTKEQIASITNNLHFNNIENIDQVVHKVLDSPSVQALMANYNLNSKIIGGQETLIKELQSQIDKLQTDLNAALLSNSAKFVQLSHSIKRCCRLNALQMEMYLNRLINAIVNSKEHKENMAQWLATLFVAQNELETKLHNATAKLSKHFDDLIVQSGQKVMDDISLKLERKLNVGSDVPPDQLQIRAIVKQALATYDADKTGLVDYALESAGGQILSTRCTEHYSARTSVVSIFGIPLWYPSASPRTVITPGVVPGECWAFQSFPGFVIIKLSHNVTIDAFSYEHVSRSLIPSGRLDSAPKDFQVFGLQQEHDREPVLLGEYRYDANGDELQFFPVTQTQSRSFQIVELKVNSNHGNPNYTCLYRFRVHGKIAT